jgi:hypothetical protein
MKLATPNHKSFATFCFRERRHLAGELQPCDLRSTPAGSRRSQAFTLAEVLAAMLFLAIVIPTAVEALHISSLMGEVAARKGAAVRIADRVLNESLVTTNWTGSAQNGTVAEGPIDYRWTLSAQNWPQAQTQNPASSLNSTISMEMLTAQVTFQAQGKDYTVKLSTLANSPNQAAAMLSLQ